MPSNILVITGMHRSGTSLVSQYLSECGLFVGSSLINLESSSNLSAFNGHHEDKDFIDFQKNILDKRRIYSFPTRQWRLPPRISLKERRAAQNILDSRKNLAQWAWKDPRTTLFLDFWDKLIDQPKYLFLFRKPTAVVDSLIRRNTDKKVLEKPIIGLKAWKVFNQRLIKFYMKAPELCLLCDIDMVISDPNYVPTYLAKKFWFDLSPIEFSQVFKASSFKSELSELTQVTKQRYKREFQSADDLYESLFRLSIDQKDRFQQ